ncbi:MAG: nucleotide exchange factor GrpE [Oscillospiraceae bacterium]|nr:nucleotide exchange factor GrpE [Oscillospiraceae bacterium]
MSKKEKDEVKEETVKEPEVETEDEKDEQSDIEKQLRDTKDQLLRTAAEYANFRARSAKEKEQTYSNAKGNVVAEILPSIDNLERALAQENSDYESLRKGLEMTMNSLMAALEKMGVKAFGEVGEQFDPNLHHAVMHIDDESLGENVITDVFQKGYKINDKVVRPAMVKTAN